MNKAIQNAKETEEALQERCNLMYFDMPQSTNMLQAYWLDYEIYFRITSSYKYAEWIKKKVITPPFTNHSDVPDDKEDVTEPTYNRSSTIDDGIISPDAIQILPQDNRLEVGEQMVLTVLFSPDDTTNKSLDYTSSAPSTASVSKNGIVTGIKTGRCQITVMTPNGIRATKDIIVYIKSPK